MAGDAANGGLLPKEEVARLFQKYRLDGDADARNKLVAGHSRLAKYLASKFINKGEAMDDLIQVAHIGLINAIDRYDPDRGVAFSTFSTLTILGELKRHFRDKGWAVKVPRKVKNINIMVNKAVNELESMLQRTPTVAEVAKRLSINEEELIEALEMGKSYHMVSLNQDIRGAEFDGDATKLDFVGQADDKIERLGERLSLGNAVSRLTETERAVLYYRYFEDRSQCEIADKLNVSQMQISRIHRRALEKIRKFFNQ